MFNRSRRRNGFTLPEVLVTVAIVAILAAVVVPAVTQQISKGEDGQITGGLQGVITGVTSYSADVRRYPLFLSDLSTTPATGDSTPGGVLTDAEVARWRGPYMQTEVDSAGTLSLGLLSGKDHFWKDGTFLAMTVATSNADSARVVHVDSIVDGGDGLTDGKVRWVNGSSTFDSAWVRLIVAR